MSNAISAQQDQDLVSVLQNSLYVGAQPESIHMVMEYCRAAKLDVLQKPVHIVGMWDSKAGQMRDVVMPGIGLYRIQADRSGTLAGVSAPEFGPEVTRTFHDKKGVEVTVTFPEWCKVTVKKLVGSHIVDFVGFEYWIENYATDSSKSDAPNAMWRKRVRGQIAKCAEAQALRKAFPEIGQQPTAEEMEGKVIDMGDADVVTESRSASLPEYPTEKFEENMATWRAWLSEGRTSVQGIIDRVSTAYQLTPEQTQQIHEAANIVKGETA